MKNVIILGAGGSLAKYVVETLKTQKDIHLTLFLRNKSKLKSLDVSPCTIIEDDVLNYTSLKDAIQGQDIIYVNLT